MHQYYYSNEDVNDSQENEKILASRKFHATDNIRYAGQDQKKRYNEIHKRHIEQPDKDDGQNTDQCVETTS